MSIFYYICELINNDLETHPPLNCTTSRVESYLYKSKCLLHFGDLQLVMALVVIHMMHSIIIAYNCNGIFESES